jgi:hypothetical protein
VSSAVSWSRYRSILGHLGAEMFRGGEILDEAVVLVPNLVELLLQFLVLAA